MFWGLLLLLLIGCQPAAFEAATAVPESSQTPLPTKTMAVIQATATATPLPTATAQPIEPTETAVSATESISNSTIIIIGSIVNIRSEPVITNDNILFEVYQNTEMSVLSGPQDGDGFEWWQVRSNDGREGWVAADFIRFAANATNTAVDTTESALTITPQPANPTETLQVTADVASTATAVSAHATSVLGRSLQGRPIFAYQFGQGTKQIMLVGGIHGGYEWNSIVLAHRLIDHFSNNPADIPADVTLTIIPSANPDGHYLISGEDGNFDNADIVQDTAPGRFNANTINGLPVDLNRNWDCNWQPTALWRDNQVSGGSAPFSEPETSALRDFFLSQQPQAVIFLHSAANGVYVSGCGDLHQPSYELATIYGSAANYPIFEFFDFYEITGDAGDWLTTQGIASISIELITHEAIEFDKNLAGVKAALDYYSD